MPTATDLVTDLPADFEVFGQAVATSMADLLGGTTGQVLSKTSNTDMDFTWVAANPGDITGVTAGVGITGGGTSGTVTVTNDMATTITASGDIVVGTGSGTYDNLPIGTTNQVLTADTTVSPYKVKWATPAGGGGMTLLSTTTLSGTSTTISGISGSYLNLFILFERVTQNTTGGHLRMGCNSASTGQYNGVKEGNGTAFVNSGSGYITPLGTNAPNTSYETFGQITIYNYNTTTTNSGKSILSTGATYAGGAGPGPVINTSYYDSAAGISSLYFAYSNGGTISGTVKIYGVN
jgi:hypothetical protein